MHTPVSAGNLYVLISSSFHEGFCHLSFKPAQSPSADIFTVWPQCSYKYPHVSKTNGGHNLWKDRQIILLTSVCFS